jgi:hypothetical protein
MGWFESLRKWIDGEEDIDEKGQPLARSKWDDFLVSVAREVEQTMQREMFTPPGGPTYVPREYVVFMSATDDADWQGEKREGLERGLYHVLSERARELAGENEFQTKTLTVELRVDPGLESGHFRVQHIWDTEAQKTMVKPRKRTPPQDATSQNPASQNPASQSLASQGFATIAEEREEEATIVRPRKSAEPNFSVLVRRNMPGADTAPPDVRPFFKDEITIGRGSRQVDVDLRLEGDLEVSRQHAMLKKSGDDYTLTCKGANSITVNDEKEILSNESATVKPGDKISICSYELAIQ